MAYGWEGFKPAPIESFHGEALEEFHKVKKFDHSDVEKTMGEKIGTIDGSEFSRLLAVFKTKIMEEYNIDNKAIPITKE